jgi:hypothetical protein
VQVEKRKHFKFYSDRSESVSPIYVFDKDYVNKLNFHAKRRMNILRNLSPKTKDIISELLHRTNRKLNVQNKMLSLCTHAGFYFLTLFL